MPSPTPSTFISFMLYLMIPLAAALCAVVIGLVFKPNKLSIHLEEKKSLDRQVAKKEAADALVEKKLKKAAEIAADDEATQGTPLVMASDHNDDLPPVRSSARKASPQQQNQRTNRTAAKPKADQPVQRTLPLSEYDDEAEPDFLFDPTLTEDYDLRTA